MKTLSAIIALSLAALSLAQEPIDVYLDPTEDAPKIGDLETPSLAIPAEWPTGVDSREGWQPIYYRGAFVVYVDNNDIGKDLAPKPGSLYYLGPSKDATKLTIATEKDKTDILSVDTWWCKMQLETILVGYIRSSSVDASSIISNLPQANPDDQTPPAEGPALKELQGTLQTTGLIGKSRSGLDFKLVGPDGKTLAFVDVSQLPERIHVKELIDSVVRASGELKPNDNSDTLILVAQSLKKAN